MVKLSYLRWSEIQFLKNVLQEAQWYFLLAKLGKGVSVPEVLEGWSPKTPSQHTFMMPCALVGASLYFSYERLHVVRTTWLQIPGL